MVAPFRSRVLDVGSFANTRVIRDHTKRKVFAANEPQRYASPHFRTMSFALPSLSQAQASASCHNRRRYSLRSSTDTSLHRQALRYIIRNTTLPQRMRAQAQLKLWQMHLYTRRTIIRNRCLAGGKTRGILSKFGMSRVRWTCNTSTTFCNALHNIGRVTDTVDLSTTSECTPWLGICLA